MARRFAMLIVEDPEHSEADAAAAPSFDDWHPYATAKGAYVEGIRFQPPETARTVRVRDGLTIVTEGSFTASAEKLLGIAVIECETWDEAIDLAVHNNMAHEGRIELREIHSMGGPE